VSSQTGNPPSQADLDRQVLDANRAIAANPQDWKAYRVRGWARARFFDEVKKYWCLRKKNKSDNLPCIISSTFPFNI
jgi:hypothetical protein